MNLGILKDVLLFEKIRGMFAIVASACRTKIFLPLDIIENEPGILHFDDGNESSGFFIVNRSIRGACTMTIVFVKDVIELSVLEIFIGLFWTVAKIVTLHIVGIVIFFQ